MADTAPDDVRAFLSEGTRTAKLATVSAEGRPHIVPVWFVLDGDDVIFTIDETSPRDRALRRYPRVPCCVDDDRRRSSYIKGSRTAMISTDLNDLVRWATRIGGRYAGADRAEEFGRRNGVPGELLVRSTPTKVIAAKDVAS